jgi:multidrug efflux pump subunit AcrB
VQVEIPQHEMSSVEDVLSVPVMQNGAPRPLLGDVATVSEKTAIGEYHRYNQQRMITLTANVSDEDLGSASNEVFAAVARAGEPPDGVTVSVRGQIAPMRDTLNGLASGLGLAVVAIFLLLAAYFQSVKIAVVVIGTIPAVIAGVALSLFVTGSTLNIQSFMGAIMAIGVAVANAILLATFAEQYRQEGAEADAAASRGATSRLRPILMTTSAMIAGMVPLALGAEQIAPLGRAVIGGLAASTVATLLVLPAMFALVQRRASAASPSLDPDDVMSRHHSGEVA